MIVKTGVGIGSVWYSASRRDFNCSCVCITLTHAVYNFSVSYKHMHRSLQCIVYAHTRCVWREKKSNRKKKIKKYFHIFIHQKRMHNILSTFYDTDTRKSNVMTFSIFTLSVHTFSNWISIESENDDYTNISRLVRQHVSAYTCTYMQAQYLSIFSFPVYPVCLSMFPRCACVYACVPLWFWMWMDGWIDAHCKGVSRSPMLLI